MKRRDLREESSSARKQATARVCPAKNTAKAPANADAYVNSVFLVKEFVTTLDMIQRRK